MEKYDWESNIKMNILTLRVLGLWPKGDDYTRGPYMAYMIFLVVVFMIMHLFSQTLNMYYKRTDLQVVTGTVYVLLVEIICVFKVYFLVTNMDMLKNLLKDLKTDMFQPKNFVQINHIKNSIKFWKIIYNFYLYFCIGTDLFWVIYPLFELFAHSTKRLPFFAWYPFETSESPVYELTFLYQITSVVFFTTVHVNLDSLVAALNVFNASQFDILCDNLRNLHKFGENVAVSFVNCVKHHKVTLSYAEKCNNFLNWILFVQFFVSALCIGMTMFQLTVVVPNSSEFYSLLVYGIAITLQIFMYCHFGNEVEVKSSNIPYAAFECDWTNFSREVKKDLIFFSLKTQRPVKLAALNLFDLSLDIFVRIMKTSWSYFALLNQMNSTE